MTLPPMPTMVALANSPPREELQRTWLHRAIGAITKPELLRSLPGRHERLAAKHTNAADAAREGEPTPPSAYGEACKPGAGRIGRTVLRALGRQQWRDTRAKGPRQDPKATPPAPRDETPAQRKNLIRGSCLA